MKEVLSGRSLRIQQACIINSERFYEFDVLNSFIKEFGKIDYPDLFWRWEIQCPAL